MKRSRWTIMMVVLACVLVAGLALAQAGVLYRFGTEDDIAGILEVYSGSSAPGAVNVYGPTTGAWYRPDMIGLYSRTGSDWCLIQRQNGLKVTSSTGGFFDLDGLSSGLGLRSDGPVVLTGLPTSDPHVLGALYTWYGYLKVSAGGARK